MKTRAYTLKKTLLSLSFLMLLADIAKAQFALPEDLQKACAFVMRGDRSIGSGFFIRVPHKNYWMSYFVTAKHVVSGGTYTNDSDELILRVNQLGSRSAAIVKIPLSLEGPTPWLQHTNPGVDLAVFPMFVLWPKGAYDVMFLDYVNSDHIVHMQPGSFCQIAWVGNGFNFAKASSRALWKVGPGSETITLGLVPHLYSPETANIVVYRYGRIAAMPDFEIPSAIGGLAKAFILDSPVIKGNSGGPAFVWVKELDPTTNQQNTHPHLLGVVSAFVPSIRQGVFNIEKHSIDTTNLLYDNAGLSHVVPVDYLLEILHSSEAKQYIDRYDQAVQAMPQLRDELYKRMTDFQTARKALDEALAAMQNPPRDQVPVQLVTDVHEKIRLLNIAMTELNATSTNILSQAKVFNRKNLPIKLNPNP